MSVQLPNSFIAEFDAQVHHVWQHGSKLGDCVRKRTNVTGSTYRFHKMGKGMAQPRVYQTDVTPMNVSHSGALANLTPWVAPEYTDIFAKAQVNFDETRELVKTVGFAIGRRFDQLIIDDALSQASTNTIAIGVGGNNAFNIGKMRAMKQIMDDKGVPSSDRHMLLSAAALQQLLGDTEVTSSDYNTVKALVNGELNTYVGFNIKMMETRDEGGLPLNGTTRTIFAWHRDAIGAAVGIPETTEINYVPEKLSWLVAGKLLAGAINIDNDGVVQTTIDDTLVI